MKVGDFVKIKDCYDINLYDQLPTTGIIIGSSDTFHIKLHNKKEEVLTKYYKVISESR